MTLRFSPEQQEVCFHEPDQERLWSNGLGKESEVVSTIILPLTISNLAIIIVRTTEVVATLVFPLPVTITDIFIVRMNEVVTVSFLFPLLLLRLLLLK